MMVTDRLGAAASESVRTGPQRGDRLNELRAAAKSQPAGPSTQITRLKPGTAVPEVPPRRYRTRDGYVVLRWRIGPRQYVDALERYYRAVRGVSWREAVEAGETPASEHPEWSRSTRRLPLGFFLERSPYRGLLWRPGNSGAWGRMCGFAYVTGLVSGGVMGFGGERGEFRGVWLDWKRRPYRLGLLADDWGWLLCKPFHLLRYGHWPGPRIALFGSTCGTCVPWPCCGATGQDHAENCTDA